jgi:phage-related protein
MIADAITIISNAIQLFLNLLQGDWSGAWNNLKNIVRAFWDQLAAVVRFGWETIKNLFWLFINTIWSFLKAFVTTMVDIGRNWINGIKDGVTGAWSGLWNFIVSIPGKITGAIGDLNSLLVNAGKAVINGLINGIESKIQSLKNALKSMTNLIPSWKGPAEVDKNLLFNNGQMIMQGLVHGLDSGMGDVKSYLNGVTASANFTPNIAVTGNLDQNQQLDLEKMTDRIVEAIHGIKPVHVDSVVTGESKPVATLDFWGSIKNSGNS